MNKLKPPKIKRFSPSPILQVSQINSTSFETNATLSHFQIFNHILLRRKSYAFQLFKQFILFSDSQSSIECSSNKINQEDLQNALYFLGKFFIRVQQKQKLIVFAKLKSKYFKKKLVYRNKKYLTKIVNSITNLIKDEHHEILNYVFLELIHNLKVSKNQQILMRNSSTSFPKYIEFQDKNFKLKNFGNESSFHLDSNQHSKILRNHADLFFESDSRIQIFNDLDLRKNFKTVQIKKQKSHDKTLLKHPQSNKKNTSQVIQQIFIIKNNKTTLSSHKNNNQKRFKRSSSNYSVESNRKNKRSHQKSYLQDQIQLQNNNIINYRQSRNHQGKKNYIKIPILTQNINVVELNTNNHNNEETRSHRKQRNFQKNNQLHDEHIDCLNCKYCKNKQTLTKAKILLKTAREKIKYKQAPSNIKITLTQFSYQ